MCRCLTSRSECPFFPFLSLALFLFFHLLLLANEPVTDYRWVSDIISWVVLWKGVMLVRLLIPVDRGEIMRIVPIGSTTCWAQPVEVALNVVPAVEANLRMASGRMRAFRTASNVIDNAHVHAHVHAANTQQ
jgi:hypothetical protein